MRTVVGAALVPFQAVNAIPINRVLPRPGETLGTAEEVGLRSTKIRILGRSLVSVPNRQRANLTLENLSFRDKLWFHPSLRLRFDTTAGQIQSILEG